MADAARWGRRKQANPRRKNVDTNEIAGVAVESKTDIGDELSAAEPQTDTFHDEKPADHDSVEASIKNEPPAKVEEDPTPAPQPLSHDSKPENSIKDEPDKNVLPAAKPNANEDDIIKWYLNRSDTAVIYPEAVSNHDDDTSQTEDSLTATDDELIAKCAHCCEGFSRSSLLRDHMRSAHTDKPLKYMCPKCDEVFTVKLQLDKHLAVHLPTAQACKICQKTFANVYRLQRHMISHDESTDLRKFKCPECGKAFKFKHHLKEHIRIHSGEKPFECQNCSKRFSHSGSYSSHMTSKKCWAVNIKGRRVDRNGNSEQTFVYNNPNSTSSSSLSIHVQPPPGGYPPHFMPFNPRGTGLPAYYSPPSSTAPSFIPYGMYAPTMVQPPKISPDINSNVKPLPMAMDKTPNFSPCKPEASASQISELIKQEGNIPGLGGDGIKQETVLPSDHFPCPIENKQSPDTTQADGPESDLQCQYCQTIYTSPIDLHQHERYLCKENKDVLRKAFTWESSRNSPNSVTSSDNSKQGNTTNGSCESESEDDDVTEMFKDDGSMVDGRKFRMRSLISDEQLQYLKQQYNLNSRPRRNELIQIGNTIHFPKRVVQVWFQNMRARERKRSKNQTGLHSTTHFVSLNQDEAASGMKMNCPYIPVVPQPYSSSAMQTPPPNVANFPAHSNTVKSNGYLGSSPLSGTTPPPAIYRGQDQPLDLSVKKDPPRAHSSTPPQKLNSPYVKLNFSDDQALNLSIKDAVNPKASTPSNARLDNCLQGSAIYQYLKKEGLFSPSSHHKLLNSRSSLPFQTPDQSPTIRAQLLYRQIKNAGQAKSPVIYTKLKQEHADTDSPEDSDGTMESSGRLMIAESDHEDLDYHSGSDDDDKHANREGRNGMLNNSLNMSIGSGYFTGMDYDQEDGAVGTKRMRKKSWRVVEAEEIQLELEDSIPTDDELMSCKKRKSWKKHRIDLEEGMYACDQCDKMFNKQSSLARHKYEHSGARPFICDVCAKAFKHKHHLTEHKRLHNGEKPFQCRKCGKRFSHSGSFSQHMNHRYKYCKPLKPGEEDDEGKEDLKPMLLSNV